MRSARKLTTTHQSGPPGGPKASLVPGKEKCQAVPTVLGKPSQRFALCGEKRTTVWSQHPREQRSRDPHVLSGAGGRVTQQILSLEVATFPIPGRVLWMEQDPSQGLK